MFKHNIPYNPLHDKGFVSIGCAPCTRAVKEGEDFRAGRNVDTGHNFEEAISYRDNLAKQLDEKLIVRYVTDTIKAKKLQDGKGKFPSRNGLQTYTLLDVIEEFEFDACIGGARRDEEKARAKERIFSVRDEFGQWDPKMQRPELWNIYNGKVNKGENVRVFPISNWTELDVWNYIKREKIELPSIYFTHERECILTENGQLVNTNEFVTIEEKDVIVKKKVRYRTVGDMTCTAAVESEAYTVDDIIAELKEAKISERGATRMDDRVSEAAMEDRKKGGYF
ncbi:MAG: sulfate adenylyltransferase subunit CysD [Bacteroidetes bacterium]|nr:sulfate adenylyltransferase subunit CysD [Bacteroidota bacterium]